MLLTEGVTCWKLAHAERVAFLIDAESYFDCLVSALELAQRSILIVGWDIHSQTRLRRGGGIDEDGFRLGPLLDRLAAKSRRLHIHLLMWDFPMLYATEREMLQRYRLGWKSHRRVHFELDSNHPLGASHHQKIVVVDDQVAFVGGLDLTMRRWDTAEHSPAHPLRKDPNGKPYGPFHDVQLAISGAAARALGDLARERWRRATGRRLRTGAPAKDAWPPGLEVDLTAVDVGICRTEPQHDGRQEVREIEQLYQEAIACAERYVILENQYATSAAIAEALETSLRQDEGPEILLIQPRETSGWLEKATIGTLRQGFLQRIRAADTRGRFLSCYPSRQDLGEDWIKVHSKVCIVDDTFVTVGSANLANRSMGLDTECNVAIEVDGPHQRRALRHFRDRLIGEHLDMEPARVSDAFDRFGSPAEVIRHLPGDRRRLELLEETGLESEWVANLVADENLLDPEGPIEADQLLEEMGLHSEADQKVGRSAWWKLGWIALIAILLTLAWRFGPLSDWMTAQRVEAWIEAYRSSPGAFPLTVGLFLVGGLIFFPVTLLILQTTTVFGPFEGFLYGLTGSMVSATAMFALGRLLGGRTIRRLGGEPFARVTRFLSSRGVLSVAAIRLTPIAPFTMVNLGAGAVGIRWLPFLLGTILGMVPGIAALSWLGDRAAEAIHNPSWETIAILLIAATLLLGLAKLVARKSTKIASRTDDR